MIIRREKPHAVEFEDAGIVYTVHKTIPPKMTVTMDFADARLALLANVGLTWQQLVAMLDSKTNLSGDLP